MGLSVTSCKSIKVTLQFRKVLLLCVLTELPLIFSLAATAGSRNAGCSQSMSCMWQENYCTTRIGAMGQCSQDETSTNFTRKILRSVPGPKYGFRDRYTCSSEQQLIETLPVQVGFNTVRNPISSSTTTCLAITPTEYHLKSC